MSYFRARYPTSNEQQGMQFEISEIGRDYKFYIPSPRFEKCGLAFRVAYYEAIKQPSNDKELCSCVGSMLCAVSNDLKPSVLEALHRIGVEPRIVELPSQARKHGIDDAQVRQMDWSSILVNFACICILLLKNIDWVDYKKFMSSYICELKKRVGVEPLIQLNVPFDLYQANADTIRTMLGASLTLRASVTKLIMGNMNEERPKSICSVCEYLFDIVSWSGMDELICLNSMIVPPEIDDVLCDPEHSWEVDNLHEACAAIHVHPYPQFFMHLASNVDLLKVEQSRFPTLFKIAQKRAQGRLKYYSPT